MKVIFCGEIFEDFKAAASFQQHPVERQILIISVSSGLPCISQAANSFLICASFKRNILASTFIPHPLLSQQEFSKFALDYLVFGNAFAELRRNALGKPLRLETSPAKYTRRGVEDGVYWFVNEWKGAHQFDVDQELYGLPEYLSALNSAWLNEAATLFRRKYYQNGTHAGYILYMTDAAQSSSDIERMR